MTSASTVLLIVAALLFLAPRMAPKVMQWMKSDGTTPKERLIIEATALEELKLRAQRRSAENLAKNLELVEETFMDGEEPR